MTDQDNTGFPAGLPPPPEKKGFLGRFKGAFSRAKTGVTNLRGTVGTNLGNKTAWTQRLQKLQALEVQSAFARLSEKLQSRGFNFYGMLLTVLLCAFFLADLAGIYLGEQLEKFTRKAPPPPAFSRYTGGRQFKRIDDYNVIFARNLFNSRGLIPGEETKEAEPTGVPVKTTLPINLVGTLVLTDELRSIATVEDKSQGSVVYPLRVRDQIPDKLEITAIEPTRVVFKNLSSRRLEFAELPQDDTVAPQIATKSAPKKTAAGSGVAEVAPNQYALQRGEVDKTLADLNNVLTQARCTPAFDNGVAGGFRCFQIVPGSIYDKLGMKNGDIITGLNGQPMSDPTKAIELLNELKNSNTKHLELSIKRDGRTFTNSYDIN